MASLDTITTLSERISRHSKTLSAYLQEQNKPFPTWGVDGPAKLDIPYDGEIAEAYYGLLSSTKELHSLILGPIGILMNMQSNVNFVVSLQAIYRFNLASSFPVHSSASYSEIAAKANIDIADARRLIRHATTNHIFAETAPGRVEHTSVSKVIAENDFIRNYVGTCGEEYLPAAARTVDAIEKFGHASHPSHCGWALANGNNLDGLYPSFLSNPDYKARGRRWADGMSGLAVRWNTRPLIESYPWNTLSTIVDIGGAHGPVSKALALAFPHPFFIVEDFEHVVEGALANLPPELHGRIEFRVHDFFQEQVVKGADAYFFRGIFNDWPDEWAVNIVRAQVPAMARRSRLLIYDGLNPDPGELPAHLETQKRNIDLSMSTYCGANQRTVEDWTRILKQADPRLEIKNVIKKRGELLVLLDIMLDI